MNFESQTLQIAIAFLFAGLVQGVGGFGSALILAPILIPILDIRVAPALMIVSGIPSLIFILIRYRTALSWKTVWPLSAASLLMIPAGILMAGHLNVRWIYALLSFLLIAFSLSSWTGFVFSPPRGRWIAFLAGGCSGFLGGACNTDGPPIILYGNCSQWNSREFKSNLQAFFSVNTLMLLVSHFFAGNLTSAVFRYAVWTAPALLAGTVFGVLLDPLINQKTFRKICLVLLLGLGIRMVFLAIAP